MITVTASPETLLRQASMTAELYAGKAKEWLDESFGTGYAAKNPVLMAAMIQAAVADFATASFRQMAEQISEAWMVELQNSRTRDL